MLNKKAFTIIELLIVIVVIAILSSISIVSYSNITSRSAISKRENDLTTYYKAIIMARDNTGKRLNQITNNYWSAGYCSTGVYGGNPSNTEPKNLAKNHPCWVWFYDNIDKISAASGVNLSGLKTGDNNGNPYILDENEEENGVCGLSDKMYYFDGNGTASYTQARILPKYSSC